MIYKKIKHCRICRNVRLECVLDLGEQALTGVFPRDRHEHVPAGPLRLVKCTGGDEACGLLQLEHSYDSGELYGENYGYRSGLNASMVEHLHSKVTSICRQLTLRKGDLVVDIGSNDGTTLKAYPSIGLVLVGIDPTGVKFHRYYPSHIHVISDFFSPRLLKEKYPGKKAKVITSFAMFYDLEDPLSFMRDIHDVLADDGIWVFEQSYMPTMLKMNSYDTVCHEHSEYYALGQVLWMANIVGFSIVDVEFNHVNGGSFSVTVKKATYGSKHSPMVDKIMEDERRLELTSLDLYKDFLNRIKTTKIDLLSFIKDARKNNKVVYAIGASTKGNVLLQYCGLTEHDIPFVGEINEEKFGCYTPGSKIPIIAEDDVIRKRPDYLIILPWHFKKVFLASRKFAHTKLVFPLPNVSVHG